jgi:AcrR family transcriptional regulator
MVSWTSPVRRRAPEEIDLSILHSQKRRLPPRARILTAAADLFRQHGIRRVGVEAIAVAAGTNKMTLYRHFASKDELVVEWLRGLVDQHNAIWSELADRNPGDARAQLVEWFKRMAKTMSDMDRHGCPFANSLAELHDSNHPARRLIEEFKGRGRERFVRLCRQAGVKSPEVVADELFFLFEGAQLSAQSLGQKGIGQRVFRIAAGLLEAGSLPEAR